MKRKKICITILFIIVSLIIINFILWIVHYNMLIKPMLNNPKLTFETQNEKFKYYMYDGESAHYLVVAPRFLKFVGNISVARYTKPGQNNQCRKNYGYNFFYKPYLFGDNTYQFEIYDNSESTSDTDQGVRYGIFVDKELNLISEPEEGIYELFFDELHSFYTEDVIGFFGEGVFK